MARALISKDKAKQISVLARERVINFTFTPFLPRSMASSLFLSWWESYMAHFNNENDLIEALQGCYPGFLMHQLLGILTFFLYAACFGL